ncbi:MAG: LytR C-terminal domain-containing protein [Solirubrobacteraceae bacterium]
MGTPSAISAPYAFSIGHFISSVGADAGFAAIIGLGILVLLYFAQARETAVLREQAFQSAQHVQELEVRLTGLARSQAASGAAPAPPGIGGAQGGGGPAAAGRAPVALGGGPAAPRSAAPAPPAGVGAPALNAATKLIPSSESSAWDDASPLAGPRAAATASGRGSEETMIEWPGPSTAAAGANGTASDHAPSRVASPPASGVRARGPGAGAPRSPIPPERDQRRRGTRGRFAILLAGLAAVAVAAVVVVLLVVTSSGGGKAAPATHAQTSNAPGTGHRSHPAPINPSAVTVAVLNGTSTGGLAHKVAVRLAAAGYMQGTIGNTVDQTRTVSVVAYMPGHLRAARAVAASLKLGSSSVQAIDLNTQAIACPPPSPCTATVAVTVGSDLASQ